jgi:hypothetical protein
MTSVAGSIRAALGQPRRTSRRGETVRFVKQVFAAAAILGISACAGGQGDARRTSDANVLRAGLTIAVTSGSTHSSWCRPAQIAVLIPPARPDHVPFAGGIFTDEVHVRLRGDHPCRIEGTPALTLYRRGHRLATRTHKPYRNYSLAQGFVRTRPVLLMPTQPTASAEVDWRDRPSGGAAVCRAHVQPDHAVVVFPHMSKSFQVPVPHGDLLACAGELLVFQLVLERG